MNENPLDGILLPKLLVADMLVPLHAPDRLQPDPAKHVLLKLKNKCRSLLNKAKIIPSKQSQLLVVNHP